MGACWRYRVAKDEKDGKLHFVYARYRSDDPTYRCGIVGIVNEGGSIEDMRQLAQSLLQACEEPIIPLEERGDEADPDEDEDPDEDSLWRLDTD
jgi:hypothetical protein